MRTPVYMCADGTTIFSFYLKLTHFALALYVVLLLFVQRRHVIYACRRRAPNSEYYILVIQCFDIFKCTSSHCSWTSCPFSSLNFSFHLECLLHRILSGYHLYCQHRILLQIRTGCDNFKSSDILIWIRNKKSDAKLRFYSASQTAFLGTLLSSKGLRGQTLKLTSQRH
jgi:hypothetical protein